MEIARLEGEVDQLRARLRTQVGSVSTESLQAIAEQQHQQQISILKAQLEQEVNKNTVEMLS